MTKQRQHHATGGKAHRMFSVIFLLGTGFHWSDTYYASSHSPKLKYLQLMLYPGRDMDKHLCKDSQEYVQSGPLIEAPWFKIYTSRAHIDRMKDFALKIFLFRCKDIQYDPQKGTYVLAQVKSPFEERLSPQQVFDSRYDNESDLYTL